MTGVSWNPQCPVPLDDLVVLNVTHWDFNAEPRRGHLIVARSAAGDLADVFSTIYAARFQIERMRPVHTYAGGERASLNDNNTSAFHCRTVAGGSSWSQHSYGTAVDINPLQNPYLTRQIVLPADGRQWIGRSPLRRGMITPTGPVTTAFKSIGWGWGGDWKSLKDYQHFSANGR
jgi:poly-gamma-glutamate synthesis protein (capsule biosynthesis protein)